MKISLKKGFIKALKNLKKCGSVHGIAIFSNIVLMVYAYVGCLLFMYGLDNPQSMPLVVYALLMFFPTDQFMIVTSYKTLKGMEKDGKAKTQ